MVAYSFHKRFEPAIRAGTKLQTIRADRKRHALRGERIQLYVGMRSRHCRLIASPECVGVWPVRLQLEAGVITADERNVRQPMHLDAFAVSDGFVDWADMVAFWKREHPSVLVFSGWVIRWAPISPEDLRPVIALGGTGVLP